MTGPNVLYYGVVNDGISNVFNDISSYLSVFISLEPIASKKYERIFVSRFCSCLLVTESHYGLVP